MKVKELIEILKEFDPELEVLNYKGECGGCDEYGTYGTYYLTSKDINLRRETEDSKEYIEIW